MREIKFRAWDNILNEYFSWEDSVKFNNYHDLIEDNYNGAVLLEQYTGLKDKNGVDVYEGDIVTIPLNEAAYSNNTIAVVSYDENSMLLAGRLVLSRIYTAAEVIGNIHENVDLLVDDIERMIPDDIGNDIHDFLHGGDK